MLDLLQLKAFCAVVDTQSFTKAGRKVHRTQSTVSSQIAHLEQMYGTELLERLPDKTVPTESGKLLYDYAKRILALAEESVERVSELEHTLTGDLIIGASTIPATYILPGLIGTFTQDYPDITVSIQVSNSRTVLNSIRKRTIEIGAVGQKVKNPRITYIKLASDTIVLAVPPGHPWTRKKSMSLTQLSREPFISREEGSGTRAAVQEALKKKGITHLNTRISVGSSEAAKQSVKSGLGVSFISEWALKGDSLPVVKVQGLDISRTFYIAHSETGSKKRLIQAFKDWIRKHGPI